MARLEMMEHLGLAAGLPAHGEVFWPAASIVLGHAETAVRHQRPSCSQHSAVVEKGYQKCNVCALMEP
jgi:hypothetical protein